MRAAAFAFALLVLAPARSSVHFAGRIVKVVDGDTKGKVRFLGKLGD